MIWRLYLLCLRIAASDYYQAGLGPIRGFSSTARQLTMTKTSMKIEI